MTGKDIPSQTHHLRIEIPDLSLIEQAVTAFEWTQAAVKHASGKTGEHPHLHIFLNFEKTITKVAAKDRLRKHHDIFKTLSGNGNWSFRPHDNYEAWCKYVCRNISHTVIKSDDILDKVHNEALQVPLVSHVPPPCPSPPSTYPCPPVVKSARRPMREKFIDYLERERGWKRGRQFSQLDQPVSWWEQFENEVIDAATEYWEAAFTVPEGIRMVKHAMWVFSDDDTRTTIQQYNRSAIKKSLW